MDRTSHSDRAALLAVFTALCLFVSAAHSRAQQTATVPTVRITSSDADLAPRDDIYFAIARKAMQAAGVEVRWQPVSEPMQLPQERMLREVAEGRQADITWTMTSIARESRLLPVRIPLLRGLAGHRVLVVRQEDAEEFARITSLSQLQQKLGGQAQDWPDIDILRANGLEQLSATSMEQLYNQLRAGRIDYFPRAIAEVEVEKRLTDFSELAVVRSPILRYPAPFYFFVSPHKPWLAEAMQRGLHSLHQSGELQRMLEQHPNSGAWFRDEQRWEGRVIIDLNNPNLHPATPLCNASLWWQAGASPWPDCSSHDKPDAAQATGTSN